MNETEHLKLLKQLADLADRIEALSLQTGREAYDQAIANLDALTKNPNARLSELYAAEKQVAEAEQKMKLEQGEQERQARAAKEERREQKASDYEYLFRKYNKAVHASDFETARKLQPQVDRAWEKIDAYAETGVESAESEEE
ncbi:MAG: hypothetical protein JETCAE01_34470 [Anaerolineaceae bacterium]|nr:MAG: hypothetical protein JETCAE01_34470 [Anaerolineaceae bacterium]